MREFKLGGIRLHAVGWGVEVFEEVTRPITGLLTADREFESSFYLGSTETRRSCEQAPRQGDQLAFSQLPEAKLE